MQEELPVAVPADADTGVAEECRELALDLLALLGELDSARWRSELELAVRDHVARIQLRTDRLRKADLLADTLRQSLDELVEVIRACLPARDLPREQLYRAWDDFRHHLQPAYEGICNALAEQSIVVPTRRPTNYARNVLHFGSALLAMAIVHWLLSPTAMLVVGGALATWAWSMEAGRRVHPAVNRFLMWVLGPFAHPHESYRVNSATWYCTALFLLALFGSKLLVLVAIGVLGFADPMAAVIGRRFGTVKLVNGRSLQGSLTFFLTGVAVAAPTIAWTRPELHPTEVLAISAAASALSAVAELFSLRIDDNLSIPIAAAFGAGLTAMALGIAF
ncbi:MAG: hypothetical protein H6742_12345 [Alphaproteobacteria bacterium]|nr:hypothetical protein [Alphaproteobacteria bacterium]